MRRRCIRRQSMKTTRLSMMGFLPESARKPQCRMTQCRRDAAPVASGQGEGDGSVDDGPESIVAVPVKVKPAKSEGPRPESRRRGAGRHGRPKSEAMNWYILKVQSNREESIREGLLRRVAIQGLDRFFGEVIVPTEKVTEFKGGKKRVIKRKLYPGYLVVNMEINEDTWFLVRETPGIGDFTGRPAFRLRCCRTKSSGSS